MVAKSKNLKYNYQMKYDLTAHLYSLFTGLLFLVSGLTEGRFRRRIYQQTLPKIKNKLILDICCANGKGTEILSSLFPQTLIWGIDLNPNMIYYASKRNSSNSKVHFKVADCSKIPFNSKSFSLVTAVLALHEIPTSKVNIVLKEINRILEPKGFLYIIDFVMPKNPHFLQRLYYYFMRIFEDESAARFMMIEQRELLKREKFELVFHKKYLVNFLQVSLYQVIKNQ